MAKSGEKIRYFFLKRIYTHGGLKFAVYYGGGDSKGTTYKYTTETNIDHYVIIEKESKKRLYGGML